MARQRRELGATWPVDLTPGGVRMLEVELGGEYAWSLDRLKRRRALRALGPGARARACRMPQAWRARDWLAWGLQVHRHREAEPGRWHKQALLFL